MCYPYVHVGITIQMISTFIFLLKPFVDEGFEAAHTSSETTIIAMLLKLLLPCFANALATSMQATGFCNRWRYVTDRAKREQCFGTNSFVERAYQDLCKNAKSPLPVLPLYMYFCVGAYACMFSDERICTVPYARASAVVFVHKKLHDLPD